MNSRSVDATLHRLLLYCARAPSLPVFIDSSLGPSLGCSFSGWIPFSPSGSLDHCRTKVCSHLNSAPPARLLTVACFTDLWALPENQVTHPLAQRVEKAFYSRCPPESRPTFLFEDCEKLCSAHAHDSLDDDVSSVSSMESGKSQEKIEEDVEAAAGGGACEIEKLQGQSQAKKGKESKRKYGSSLLKALHSVFWLQFWLSGLLKLTSGTCCRPIRA